MKKAAVAAVAVLAAVLAALLAYDGIINKEATADFFAMNTYASAKITGADSDECAALAEEITQSLDTDILSRTAENSEVFLLNKNGGGALGKKMLGYVSFLLDVCEKSGGAFDFTLGAVSDLWNFGGTPSIPDKAALADALSHSGYKKLALAENTLTYADKAAVVDFGAAGKGIALDEIREAFAEKRIKEAVVSVGGSVLLMGEKQFTVGIRNPNGNAGSYIAKLHIPAGCVSTSGSYEQQFEENGEKYHHILDPETGYPAKSGLLSVTIISDSGILSDALSTACFVLGHEKGAALAKEYGCTAIFITENNEVFVENSSKDIIEITDGAYTLI